MGQKELHPTSGYSSAEEWANTITHFFGSVLGLVGLVVAVVFASLTREPYLIVASSIYGLSLFLLHLASTLYHAARDLKWKQRFLMADHSCIYLLIAGTYTPFALVPLRGPIGWTLFGIIWFLAILGIIREVVRPARGTWLSTGIYLMMGWLILLFLYPLAKSIPLSTLIWLIVGGVAYSIGTLFYKWHSLRYHHAIWHIWVMAGAFLQFVAVLGLMNQAR